MIVPFETFKAAQTLRDKARAPRDGAEEILEAFTNATGEQIATKAELQATEARLAAEIADLKSNLKQTEARLEAEIAEVKAAMLFVKWLTGFILAFQAAIFIKLFMY